MTKSNKKAGLLVILLLISGSILFSQEQYGWRGPGRTGIYNESGLLKKWPANGPSLLWEVSDIGKGYSSVTVTENSVYITGRKGKNDILNSFTIEGKKKWEVIYGESSDSNYPDTRGNPTISSGLIFLVSGVGDLVCIGEEGKIRWAVNYSSKYNAPDPDFGVSESPVIVDNKVIVTPGGNKSAMVAFDMHTGKVLWETPSINDVTQYVNPLIVNYGGKKMIITQFADYLFAVNSVDGKLIWKFNYMNECKSPDRRFCHINTPIFNDGFLFVSSGYDKIALKLKLNPDGSAPKTVWNNPEFDCLLGGIILEGDYLYGSNWESHSFGKWMCVNWKTGKTEWITNWYNRGSIISADGMLYIYEEKSGHVGLVKPDPLKLNVHSEFRITEGSGPYWSHPVIDKGKIYLRHGDYLAVYSLR